MPNITKLEDVDVGILRFEGIMRDFANAGGAVPSNDEMKEDLLDTLPKEIRKELLLRATTVKESFQEFASHVKTSVSQILFHEGKLSSSLNLADEQSAQGAGSENSYEEEMLAMEKKHPGRVFRGWDGRQDFEKHTHRGREQW